ISLILKKICCVNSLLKWWFIVACFSNLGCKRVLNFRVLTLLVFWGSKIFEGVSAGCELVV
ncbi:hypothetical protein, partial [Vibrio splendidus]|uniref:hypothetical protein n=1 Tax=Vibrio splendidus TaxID=29497 RepID=UPI002468935E